MTAPTSLQVCFVVESEQFAWWGGADAAAHAAGWGLPPGREAALRVALPDEAAGAVVATTVPAVLVDAAIALPALATLAPPGAASASLRAWAQLARVLDAPPDDPARHAAVTALPTAGHAALGPDGRSIWSAQTVADAAGRAGGLVGAEAGLTAVLRPYQRAGVAWMRAAAEHGGGVLADEMGLGKTVQAIAVLTGRVDRPHLVVCPTSVVGAWAREIARFAPGIVVAVHQGSGRAPVSSAAQPGTVVLTSYGLLRADAEELAAVGWDVVVLDEAQQIKNPEALAARAARTLTADLRIAMTGTPVENRLDELWSLFAFTNPGLLGTRARFRRRFATAVEQQRSAPAAQRLHEIVGPHILRRRKVDVAPELPAKILAPTLVAMSPEQEALYRRAVDEAFARGLGGGIGRRGRVLALLTRLKLVTNHPELDTPTGGPLAGRSGKLDRAVEILSEVVDTGQRALVFTQYRRTGELLADHLRDQVTGTEVPFLHGELSTAAREAIVVGFSDDPDASPILVLSLRAAGFGLTLTRATHVLHYDRWWNPAVEDQASDRAHRIGQTQPVTVHTLTTERTLEEMIAGAHTGKREVADAVIGAGGDGLASDNDLARLSDTALRALLDRPSTGPV